eukprot:365421-Chlamydomonas_euryale.AAC.2
MHYHTAGKPRTVHVIRNAGPCGRADALMACADEPRSPFYPSSLFHHCCPHEYAPMHIRGTAMHPRMTETLTCMQPRQHMAMTCACMHAWPRVGMHQIQTTHTRTRTPQTCCPSNALGSSDHRDRSVGSEPLAQQRVVHAAVAGAARLSSASHACAARWAPVRHAAPALLGGSVQRRCLPLPPPNRHKHRVRRACWACCPGQQQQPWRLLRITSYQPLLC